MIKIGDRRIGLYCGERLWRARSWKRYGLFKHTGTGFSIGPVLFWRDPYKSYAATLGNVPIRATIKGGELVSVEFWSKVEKSDGCIQAWGHTVLKNK